MTNFNVFCLLLFQRLQCLLFYDSKTTMSFDLCFQRLKCLQSFTLSKTSMSFVFYGFKNYNIFSILRFERLQYLLLYVLQDNNVLCLILSRLQCPLLLCSTRLQCPPFYVLQDFKVLCLVLWDFNVLLFFRFHIFCFLWCPIFNSKIAHMKLGSLLPTFYFQ